MKTIPILNIELEPKKHRAKGMLYGLSIGDALGKPTEFISLKDIKDKYGKDGIQDLPAPALYTDDTQMTLSIVKALLDSGEKDCELIMNSLRKEFSSWLYSDEWFAGGAGRTCTEGVKNLKKGIHWTKSGIVGSKGCGSAMRVLPVGYLYQNNPNKLREVAHASGICTHNHPTADAACIGAAYLVKLVLDGVEPVNLISNLLNFTEGISKEWDEAINKVEECLDWSDEDKALGYLGEGWIGEEAVALALYCFFKYQSDYKRVVVRAANTNGDSDSIACIAGGISGAYLGLKAIPQEWIQKIDNSDYIEYLAERLFEKKNRL